VELSSGSWGTNCGACCKEAGKAAGPVLAQTGGKLAAEYKAEPAGIAAEQTK
jgi:hypothetical protein